MSDQPLTDLSFATLALHPTVLAGLEQAGLTFCTPIQKLTLPVALSGRDIAGQAQTGTGKTLAFLVAVAHRLVAETAMSHRRPMDPRALILAPTRELAIQIHKDAERFCLGLNLRFALIYGGVDYEKQRLALQQGIDIIIATPGRLIDFVRQQCVVDLSACEICVLDEADRMFDLGFIKDVRFLLRKMPPSDKRQTLLFSTTLNYRILELAYEHMNRPQKLTVESETITVAQVRQTVYFPAEEEKIPLLLGLLARKGKARTMVFVNTKAVVDSIARALMRQGYKIGILSGDVAQRKRESLLTRFQQGDLDILVATDVAARGIHIDGLEYVYNFDLPNDPRDYVHRIGRTARLGADGDAISFACERYAQSLPDIEAFIEQKIPVASVTSELLTTVPHDALQSRRMSAVDIEAGSARSDRSANFRSMRSEPVVGRSSDSGRRRRRLGSTPIAPPVLVSDDGVSSGVRPTPGVSNPSTSELSPQTPPHPSQWRGEPIPNAGDVAQRLKFMQQSQVAKHAGGCRQRGKEEPTGKKSVWRHLVGWINRLLGPLKTG